MKVRGFNVNASIEEEIIPHPSLFLVKCEATHTHEVKHLEEHRVQSDMKETA